MRLPPVLLLALLAAAPLAADTVVAVRVEGQEPAWGLEGLVTVRAGEALDPIEVRRSVQNLYDSGRVERVVVEKEPAEGGIAVRFRLTPYPEVRKVVRDCEGCPRPPAVLPGTPCTPELLDKVKGAVVSRLARDGYLHPHVEAVCEGGRLVLSGGRGPQSRVSAVAVDADAEAAALDRLQNLVGRPYRPDRVAAALASLEKRIRKARPQAKLRVAGWEETADGVAMRVEARGLGPVDFTASGDAAAKDLKRLRRSLRGEPITEEILAQRADETARRYRAQGFAEAQATITQEKGAEASKVRLELTTGPRYALGRVQLEGLKAANAADLLAFLPEGPRFYDPEEARNWQGILLDRLQEEGYLDAVVKGPDVRLDRGTGTVDLTFRIEEGVRYVPDAVEALGLPEGFTPPVWSVKAGEPLSPGRVQADLEALQARLDDAGYSNARVAVRKEAGRLTYAVDPGPRAVVDRLFYRGLWYTRPERLASELRLRPGDPVSFSRVLETQSLLYATGLFSTVDVHARVEPEDPTRATMILAVEEDTPRSYLYGLGYDTYDGIRVQGGLYHNNLFGTRRAVGLEGRYSGKEQQFRAFYREPRFFFIPHPIQVSVFQSQEQRPDFSLDKFGTTVELARTWGGRTRATLRYAYEIQDAFDITEGYPVPREDADKNVSSIGLGWIHDARDEPFYPTAGRFATVNLRYAFPLRNATSHFFLTDLRGAAYFSPTRKTTLALSVRGGVILNKLDDEEIPLGERFFLGGQNTVRAFSRDAVGVEGQTVVDGSPIGGNAFVLINAEWRHRVSSWVGLSLFLDSGQVWAEHDDADWDDLRSGTGWGLGLLLFSPLGPIRVEWSRKLDPCPWDSREQWYFGIGVPF